jgi:carboxyl-terminal processing protease
VASRTTTKAARQLQTALGDKVPKFRDALVDYALSLKASHAVTNPDFVVTPAMRDELYRRLQSRGIDVPRAVYDSAAPLVTQTLGGQIARYAFGNRTEFLRGLRDDPALTKALALLDGVPSPKALIARGGRGRAP